MSALRYGFGQGATDAAPQAIIHTLRCRDAEPVAPWLVYPAGSSEDVIGVRGCNTPGLPLYPFNTACAAAKRAIGTRNGEAET